MINLNHGAGGSYHWREYEIEDLIPGTEAHRDVLLLGCGDAGERPLLEERGFRCVGLDIRKAEGVNLTGDAHRLPFANSAFDVVLSMQVLEHLRRPWIAVEEVARVLRPGGYFVGSVAFLKPYHSSYFHMTHDGVRELLESSDLRATHFHGAQSLTYTLIGGMFPVGGRPLRRTLLGAWDHLLFGLRALFWSLTRREDPDRPTQRFSNHFPFSFRSFDRLRYAPAVVFTAVKPGADHRGL